MALPVDPKTPARSSSRGERSLYGLFAFIDDVSAAGQQWILFFIVGVAFFGANEVKKKNKLSKIVEEKEE